MLKLSLIDGTSGYYTVEGNLTFAAMNKHTQKEMRLAKVNDAICIDLASVEIADSAGLALMIEWIKQSKKLEVQLKFKNIPEQLRAIAMLSGFEGNEYFSCVG
jgi:phospholipid transport system transporter-binding protein